MLAHAILGLCMLVPRLASAKTHHVTVGGPNGEPIFTPSWVHADPQDEVLFTFNPKNNTVTQSSLADPCLPLAGGIDTGFTHPVAVGTPANERPTYSFIVEDGNPIWVYSRQNENTSQNFCSKGMVFAVNPGARHSNTSFRQFEANAISEGSQLALNAPPPPSASPAEKTQAAAAELDSLNRASSSSSSSDGVGSYGPVIIGLLSAVLILLVVLVGFAVLLYIRRGARPSAAWRRYAPLQEHVPPSAHMGQTEGFRDERLYAESPAGSLGR